MEDFGRIADLMLTELKDSLKERGITLAWTQAAIGYLCDKSYSIKYGARNLRRLIQKEIEDAVSSLVIAGFAEPVSAISIDVRDGTISLTSI